MGRKALLFSVALAAALACGAEARAQGLPPPPVPPSVAWRYEGPVARRPAPGEYVVVAGDTLSWIAERFGCSLGALIAANPQIRDPHWIYPGDLVHLPARSGSVGTWTTLPPSAAHGAKAAGSEAIAAARSLEGLQNWAGWCLKMVATAFAKAGHPIRELQTDCAKDAFLACRREGLVHSGPPPLGSIVFWSWVGTIDHVTRDWGHVAISNGDGTVITTTMSGAIDPGAPLREFGEPLGWVAPPP